MSETSNSIKTSMPSSKNSQGQGQVRTRRSRSRHPVQQILDIVAGIATAAAAPIDRTSLPPAGDLEKSSGTGPNALQPSSSSSHNAPQDHRTPKPLSTKRLQELKGDSKIVCSDKNIDLKSELKGDSKTLCLQQDHNGHESRNKDTTMTKTEKNNQGKSEKDDGNCSQCKPPSPAARLRHRHRSAGKIGGKPGFISRGRGPTELQGSKVRGCEKSSGGSLTRAERLRLLNQRDSHHVPLYCDDDNDDDDDLNDVSKSVPVITIDEPELSINFLNPIINKDIDQEEEEEGFQQRRRRRLYSDPPPYGGEKIGHTSRSRSKSDEWDLWDDLHGGTRRPTGYKLQKGEVEDDIINQDEFNNSSEPISDQITKYLSRQSSHAGDIETGAGEELEAVAGLATAHSAAAIHLRDQLTAMFQVSDNKLALKLFGNRNALLKEKLRQKAGGTFVIHPCSQFRFYWDVCMLSLLIANLVILPVGISFFSDEYSLVWIIFNCLSDTVFLIDLAINFRTGIIADNFADEIILDPGEITRHYIRTWFLLDLISSLPLDYLITLASGSRSASDQTMSQLVHAGRAIKMFRLVKLLSLLRLLRLSRLVRYVSQWEEFLSSAAGKFMRIFNLIALILLLGHWNGCLQFLVPMLQGFPADSWVSIEDLTEADWWEQYTWALFKALSHMLSIGFGRYAPQSITDVWLTMISMLTGATCYALFVGHTTTLIQSFDTSRRLYNDKLKQVEEYMISRKLPRQLRRRMTDYYEHRYHGKMFHEESILNELNECLKEEVVNFNCRALVASVPFFTNADPSFVSEIVTKLEFEVFLPGDFIIKEGTLGTKMYFIKDGYVDIIARDGRVTTSLGDGSYFGEICLLMKARRVASVRAETFCNLFSLSVTHLQIVLDRYPSVRQTMESVAQERLRELRLRSRVY